MLLHRTLKSVNFWTLRLHKILIWPWNSQYLQSCATFYFLAHMRVLHVSISELNLAVNWWVPLQWKINNGYDKTRDFMSSVSKQACIVSDWSVDVTRLVYLQSLIKRLTICMMDMV